MSIFIRRAQTKDASLVAELSRKTFYDTFAPYNTKADMDKFMNEQFTHDLLVKEVEQSDGCFFIAYNGDEATGYVRLRDGDIYKEFEGKNSIEIARIYAAQHVIGQGVGRAMLQFCLEEAKRMNRQVIWLGVWEKNNRAIAFYEKWGFKKFGVHDFFLGDDQQTDWLMMREVD